MSTSPDTGSTPVPYGPPEAASAPRWAGVRAGLRAWDAARRRLGERRLVKSVLPLGLLLAAVTVYLIVFGRLVLRQHDGFATFGFDLGIYDQAVWLLSRFQTPFVTVRGLHFLAHHANLSTILFVPFYWLGAGPRFLLLTNVTAMASGAVPLFFITRDRLASSWMGLAVGVVFLLLPSVEWITRWQFHPDTLALTPLLFAWWFSLRRWWVAYAVAVVLLLAAKEDAALAAAVLGVLVAVRLHRRIGLATTAAAVAWFLLATKVVIPHFSRGVGVFYTSFFAGMGNGVISIAWNIVRHPGVVLDTMAEPSRRLYYVALFGPVAFLPFLAPAALMVMAMALPQLVVNSVSGHRYTYDAAYYYSTIIDGVMMLATIEALRSLGRRREGQWYLVAVLLAVVTVANVGWSPSPVSRQYHTGIWVAPGAPQVAMRQALAVIPGDASVTATYDLVPHLTHRKEIYEFPNPWVATNWGREGEGRPDPSTVDYLALVIRPGHLSEKDWALLDGLLAPGGQFEAVYEKDGVLVARRRAFGRSGG